VLVLFLLVGEATAPWLLHILAPGFADVPATSPHIKLTRHHVSLISCSILAGGLQGGVLNSLERFRAPRRRRRCSIFPDRRADLVRPVSGEALAWA